MYVLNRGACLCVQYYSSKHRMYIKYRHLYHHQGFSIFCHIIVLINSLAVSRTQAKPRVSSPPFSRFLQLKLQNCKAKKSIMSIVLNTYCRTYDLCPNSGKRHFGSKADVREYNCMELYVHCRYNCMIVGIIVGTLYCEYNVVHTLYVHCIDVRIIVPVQCIQLYI